MDDRNREHDFDDTEEIFDDDFEVAPRRAYKRPTGRKPPTRNYATFYIITLVVAVIISMVIFAAVYNNITSEKKPSGSVAATDLPSPSADESFVASVDRVTCIGVITLLDLTAKKVEVLDVSNNAPYSLFITEGSRLQEKSGTPLLLNEFALGDIIEAEYNKNNGQVVTFSKSATAWTIPERDKVSVDLMTKIIRVDNDVYNFNDNLVALYNGERFSPDRIKPVDVITISGVATQAWSIILLKGHGTLMISDIEHIRNGVLEVDNEVYQTLDKTEPIYLSEGEHKIVIRGDNIDSYTKEVVIEANESEIVSLTDAPIKTGLISINTNVTEYRLFIDDSEYPLGEPIMIPYGEHKIRIEKEGYVTAEQTISLNEFTLLVDMPLKATLKLGKISVESFPTGAKVYIDSAYIGNSPVSVSIAMGEHTLMVSKDGYNSITLPVTVDDNPNPGPLSVELQPVVPTYNPFFLATPTPVPDYIHPFQSPEPGPYDPNTGWYTEAPLDNNWNFGFGRDSGIMPGSIIDD